MNKLIGLLTIFICITLLISCKKEKINMRCYDCSQEHISSSIDSSTYITEWEICDGWPIILNKVSKAEYEGAICTER